MLGLVLEGGSFRGIFSAGVMDALLDSGIMADYVIGASAGISNGVSYVSKQPKRNLKVCLKYRNDKRYVGQRNLIKQRSLFGLDFVYDEVPNKLERFDWKTYKAYKGQVVVVTTNAITGEPTYMDGMKMDRKCTMLRATCALPLAFPAIKIKGVPYYDGGLSDPIPLKKAMKDGCTKNIVVLTRPEGYIKDVSGEAKVAARIYRRKYPKIAERILTRHIAYNETTEYIKQLEQKNELFVFRPSHAIESFEKDEKVLKASYQMGYQMVIDRLPALKEYLKND